MSKIFTPLSIKNCVFWLNGETKYTVEQKYASYRPYMTDRGLYFNNNYLVIPDFHLKKPITIVVAAKINRIENKTILFKTKYQELMIVNDKLRYSTGNAVYLDNIDLSGVYVLRDYKSYIVLDYNEKSIKQPSLLNTSYKSDMFIGGWDGCKYGLNGYLYDFIVYESALSPHDIKRIKKYLGEKWEL